MINIKKEVEKIEQNIEYERKMIERLKLYDTYNLAEKLLLAQETKIKYQREEFEKDILNSFKSKIVKEKGIACMHVNYFHIKIDDFYIYIPMFRSKIISLGIYFGSLKKRELKDIAPYEERLAKLIEQQDNLKFFQFKKKEKLEERIEHAGHMLKKVKNENEIIAYENKKYEELKEKEKDIISCLQEDLDILSQAFTFDFTENKILKKNEYNIDKF